METSLLQSLCKKCPNTEFFLLRIFPHSNWIQRDTKYLSVFSPNGGKYGPEKTPYFGTFHAVSHLRDVQGKDVFELGFLKKCQYDELIHRQIFGLSLREILKYTWVSHSIPACDVDTLALIPGRIFQGTNL